MIKKLLQKILIKQISTVFEKHGGLFLPIIFLYLAFHNQQKKTYPIG